jgi:hypothetical protein
MCSSLIRLLFIKGVDLKNIVICLNINQKSFAGLKKVNNYIFDKNTNVTLLHIWNKKAYDYPGDMIVSFYPDEKEALAIKQEMKNNMDEQFQMFLDHSKKHLKSLVLNSSNPKKDTVGYLLENKIDLVICLSSEKSNLENFFHSSFTNYLNAHAPCDVLNIRI